LQKDALSELVRCMDTERSERVLMRIFFTGDDAEKSFLLTEAAALRKHRAEASNQLNDPNASASEHAPLAHIYDVGTTSNEYPFVTFQDVGGVPLSSISPSALANPAMFQRLVSDMSVALAHIHQLQRSLLCLSAASIRFFAPQEPNGSDYRFVLALDEWSPAPDGRHPQLRKYAQRREAAPELASGRMWDARADLYALGVVLFEALTGVSFDDLRTTDAPGMRSHLLFKALDEHAPHLPERIGQWLNALVEQDRSLRFFSAREVVEFLAVRDYMPRTLAQSLPETPCLLAPVHPIGIDAALAAVVNTHFDEAEMPVLELSGEEGVGKTMLLQSLYHSPRGLEERSITLSAVFMSAAHHKHSNYLVKHLQHLMDANEPTLVLLDDCDSLSESTRQEIRSLLLSEQAKRSGVRVIAAHRSQLAVLSTKVPSHTIARMLPLYLPTMCAETLGRCAFPQELYKDLYAVTKGHPLFVEEVLRLMVRKGLIVRRNRIWSVAQESFTLPAALQTLIIQHIQALPEDAKTLLTVLVDGNNASAALTEGFTLHALAELLDVSTQAVMRLVLPLVYDGVLQFWGASVVFRHELYREAVATALHISLAEVLRAEHEVLEPLFPQAMELPSSHVLPTAAHPAQQAPQQQSQEVLQTAPRAASALNEPPSETNQPPQTPATTPEAAQEPHQQPTRPGQTLTSGILSGSSAAVERLRSQMRLAAQYDVPMLIEGHLGSGREEMALLMHSLSNRAKKPCAVVVCSDFTDTELEHYLFGTPQPLLLGTTFVSSGALASASNEAPSTVVNHGGILAELDGGTLFLDDITYASLTVQTKLARLAQAKLRSRVSSSSHAHGTQTLAHVQPPQASDVRLIIGCGRDGDTLAEYALQRGSLQPELFFAVSSMRVTVPALAERREDIPLLVAYYRTVVAEEFGYQDTLGVLPIALVRKLQERQWAGNIMELESLVRRMMMMGSIEAFSSELEYVAVSLKSVEHQSPQTPQTPQVPSTAQTSSTETAMQTTSEHPHEERDGLLSIDDAQKEHILRALERTKGNKTKAAELLRIKRTTLIARMKKFGMMP